MVGKTGFEPATSRTRTVCSTKLSYFPSFSCLFSLATIRILYEFYKKVNSFFIFFCGCSHKNGQKARFSHSRTHSAPPFFPILKTHQTHQEKGTLRETDSAGAAQAGALVAVYHDPLAFAPPADCRLLFVLVSRVRQFHAAPIRHRFYFNRMGAVYPYKGARQHRYIILAPRRF